MQGYSHRNYAQGFCKLGEIQYLPSSKGWIIKREIPGTDHFDAMGCYPLFSCEIWNRLSEDIESLENQLVSLTLVTDPFADITYEALQQIFPVCYAFKEHYITDFSQPLEASVTKKTRKHARRALKDISVEHCQTPLNYLHEWNLLYDELIKRHDISGLRAFSKQSFEYQLMVPGVEMFIARLSHEIVGAEIFMVNKHVGYAHLVAISPVGYEYNASYALDWTAMQYFSETLSMLDHGAGAGLGQNDGGLTFYKKRWANVTLPVFLCGRILNPEIYNELVDEKGAASSSYFPAYREGEFG
jgi:hypothetical protein